RSLDWKGPVLGIVEMRRHYSNYFKGYPGIKPFRQRLVTEMDPTILFDTLDEIEDVFSQVELQPV
ncbi:MAG: tRNA dihydrouridine synthase DusB, partial [Lewinella sp.]|nr:tRNA dihydrouridine synthase DusB [Lewinella sp.]